MKHPIDKFLLMLLIGASFRCDFKKLPLPSPQSQSVSFGANDTSYVELSPMWDQNVLGVPLRAPSDIIMGPDGVIYLANEGKDQILALSRGGRVLMENGFDEIASIPHPQGLAIDSKLNLLFVNGEDKIYCWNQYLNMVTIDSIAEKGVYYDPSQKDTVHLTFLELNRWQKETGSSPILRYYLFEKDETKARLARISYLFYQHADPTARFVGVAAGKYGSETIYATDFANDKIVKIKLVPDMAIKTHDGQIRLHYIGIYHRDVATYGSGSGTVDDPWAIVTDRDENIYFTQLGGNFKVQRLNANSYTPRYVLYQHDIMDLDRFLAPYDLCLDDGQNIFVLDTGAGKVVKFANAGANAGQLLSLGAKGLALAHFKDAKGIMVSEQIVYIVETGANRIRRFQYSISDADLPDDDKKP